MSNENSKNRLAMVKALTEMAEQADKGHLDHITCPNCKEPAVSVWFKDWERTLFKCEKCDFDSLAINACKPEYYTEERDLYAKRRLASAKK